jgi:hypothetical protein
MIALCKETDVAMGGKISAQLQEMGWDDVLRKMNTEEQ